MHFGEYLIKNKIVHQEKVEKGMGIQRQSMTLIGKMAVELGYISREDNIKVKGPGPIN